MKKIIVLILIFLLGASGYGLAQETSKDMLMSKHFRFKNPFESALPKEEKPITIEIESPEPPEPPELEVPVGRRPEVETFREPVIQPPAFEITGLVWNSDRPQAIIDDKIVNIGDTINDSEVVEITRGGIGIKYKGKYFNIEKQSSVDKKQIRELHF